MYKFGKFSQPFIDQALVSGGSFLTIAISAHLLSVGEQGKLGYVIVAYLAVVIINTTVMFQWASVQVAKVKDRWKYRQELGGFQLITGVLVAVLASLIVLFFGGKSGWDLTGVDILTIFVFILFQQLADFEIGRAHV